MRSSRSRGQPSRSRAIQRVGGLLLALGLVNQMPGWARVNRKVLDPPACQGQGTGRKQRGWCLGEAAPKPKETGPRERQRSELQSDASWQVHRPADGVDHSGQGEVDFLKVPRASRARSGVGAEPAPTGSGEKDPHGVLLIDWGRRLRSGNKQ